MPGSPENDEKSIRSYILNLCKVIGNGAIAFYDFQYWYYRFLGGNRDLEFDRSSEPEPLQFSDLPVDAVGLIVDKLEVVERLMLKRVSKPLRNFIEKQEFNCTSIDVSVCNDLIIVSYGSGEILYAKNEEAVKSYKTYNYVGEALVVCGNHYESDACDDVACFIRNPKLQLNFFKFSDFFWCPKKSVVSKFFRRLEFVLKSLNHQISVKKLSLQPKQPDDVLAILPYFKPGTLEKISIKDFRARHEWESDEQSRKVEQIMQLDQWKQAKELILLESLHLFPDEVLAQFTKYLIYTLTLNQNQLLRIGMKFAASPVFECCHYYIKYPAEVNDFINFIGVPGPLTEKYRSVRHYMIPDTDKLLVFRESTDGDVEIEKMTREVL